MLTPLKSRKFEEIICRFMFMVRNRAHDSANAETQGKTVLIYGLSIENVGMLNLYTMRKITNGTLHTSGLISERDKLDCSKDPMRDIWQFYFAFFTQRPTL